MKINKVTASLLVGTMMVFGGIEEKCDGGDIKACYKVALIYSQKYKNDVEKTLLAKSYFNLACGSGIKEACEKVKELAKHSDNTSEKQTSYTQQAEDTSVESAKKKALPVKPEKSYYNGHMDGKLQCDIDNDGKLETIAWSKFASVDLGDYYQLIVLDDDGSLLWEGPQKTDELNPLVFFELDTGISLPQVLADFDHDGKIELLAPMAQSDVSPTYYRKLRWKGNGFEALIQNALMLQKGSRTRFEWKIVLQPSGIWVSKMAPASGGLVRAEITQLEKDGSVASGEALIRFVVGGAVIEEVTVPISSTNDGKGTAKYKASQEATRASVKQAVEPLPQQDNTYRARINDQDHYNSRGTRLSNLISVLRQDRANYYKYGRSRGDSADRYFSSVANRRAMEHMAIVPSGISYDSLRQLVLHGTPLLEIEVRTRELVIRVLER